MYCQRRPYSRLIDRTVKAGEEELFKSRARENGQVKIIDLITARLDAKTDSYLATLPSLRLQDARIEAELVSRHERMLTGGFYAEITLCYDSIIAQEKNSRPFGIESLREIQLSKRDVLDVLAESRKNFTTDKWKNFILRSIGIEPSVLSERQKNALFLRMVPFAERNYNLVELGPRGTGKSHLFQQISPYAHLISGGKATVARMFVHMGTGQRGLVCQYDVVCFDEISGESFDQKDGVNILKGYMESGEFSRGKEMLTNHFGLVSDFISECWSQIRNQSRVSLLQNRVFFGGALSGRDTNAVNKTVSGLMKLLCPGGGNDIPDEDLEWAVRIAMEARRRVKEQQKRIGGDPLEPGQVWTISPGGGDEHPGLYRIEINEGPGSGVKLLNKPVPPAFRESIGYAEQNFYARSMQLVGDKDPRRQLFDLSDDMATKIDIQFYSDARDALLKVIMD
ncbi:MAG: BREX system Lon protease-like protein BrxL [Pseudomonadota bacterium]